MSQNQPLDNQWGFKQNFNTAYTVMLIYQRAIIIPLREKFGKDVFGLPCALAFLFMCAWAVLSRDLFMWAWVFLWLCFLVKRKNEACHLAASGVRIHSKYDGFPRDAMRYCRTEQTAKRIVEPIQCALLGLVLLLIYKAEGARYLGLPYFFLFGAVALAFTEQVHQLLWEKRLQGLQDARIEQEALVRDLRGRYGE